MENRERVLTLLSEWVHQPLDEDAVITINSVKPQTLGKYAPTYVTIDIKSYDEEGELHEYEVYEQAIVQEVIYLIFESKAEEELWQS